MTTLQSSAADELFLRQAVELAERGRLTCSPNPCVGCLIVQRGMIVGRGYHQRTGAGHAEVNAIADADQDIRGATVYVSLEPCAFTGRTPACAETLAELGVARVVIAALDPHPRVSGAGVQILQEAGIQVSHIDLPEAHHVIRGYVSRISRQRPWVRVKSAASIDGGTALANGASKWITGAQSRADVQYWRARSDAIITGSGTARADDPALTVREPSLQPCHPPLRVVLNASLDLPVELQLFDGQVPTLLVYNQALPVADHWRQLDGVELLGLPVQAEQLDVPLLLAELAQRGCNEVLIEAGATLCGEFARNGLWDEWLMYLAPRLLGSERRAVADFSLSQLADAPSGRIEQIKQIGEDIRVLLTNSLDNNAT